MYLLDTDTLTHLYAGQPRVIKRLRETVDPDVGTTIITKIEMLRGRFEFMLKAQPDTELLRAQDLLFKTEELLSRLLIVSVEEKAITHFGQLQTIKGLRKIGHADLLIASICLAQRAVLVTRNLKHFQLVPNLVVVNWVD